MQSMNRFVIKGRIGGIDRGGPKRRGRFYINSYISKRDVNLRISAHCEIPEDIEDGDKVMVAGYLSVVPVGNGGRHMRYRQNFIATEIAKAETEMERAFGKKGEFYAPDFARYFIKGVVVGTISGNDENWKRMIVQTDGERTDRFPSRVPLDYHLTKSRFMALPEYDYKNGDAVQAVCEIKTSVKQQDGNKVHFQNFKVVDIQYTR